MVISSSIAKLRSVLAQIGYSTADLAKMSIESELTIREHCDSIRQQVDIARETAIENFFNASQVLMEELDAYERDCLSNWTATKESNVIEIKDVNKRMSEFLAEQQAYLKNVQASDT